MNVRGTVIIDEEIKYSTIIVYIVFCYAFGYLVFPPLFYVSLFFLGNKKKSIFKPLCKVFSMQFVCNGIVIYRMLS